MSRDFQRSKVYETEFVFRDIFDFAGKAPTIEVFGSTLIVPSEIYFSTLDHVQTYVDYVINHPEVVALFGKKAAVQVSLRRGAKKAHYSNNGIFLHVVENQSNWALREIVVLHEIAHHLALGDRHGPAFVGAFLSLVEIFLGPEARLIYLSLLEGSEVVWKAPKPCREKVSA